MKEKIVSSVDKNVYFQPTGNAKNRTISVSESADALSKNLSESLSNSHQSGLICPHCHNLIN